MYRTSSTISRIAKAISEVSYFATAEAADHRGPRFEDIPNLALTAFAEAAEYSSLPISDGRSGCECALIGGSFVGSQLLKTG